MSETVIITENDGDSSQTTVIEVTENTDEGTETTVIEVTTTKSDDGAMDVSGDDHSIAEQIIEAILDENPDATVYTSDDSDTTETIVITTTEEAPAEETIYVEETTTEPVVMVEETTTEPGVVVDETNSDPTVSAEESANEPGVSVEEPGTEEPTVGVGVSAVEEPTAMTDDTATEPVPTVEEPSVTDASPIGVSPETGSTTDATADNNEEAEQAADLEAHADAAKDAQAAADEYVAQGDYEAAAEAREVAENEAYAAGDDSMLGVSDSSDLSNAAYQQDKAEYYEEQQAAHAQAGDYEAAKEDAVNAEYATRDADYLAGGDDHSGQAQQEQYQMDEAVWDEKNADYFADAAEDYAEAGNYDAAESAAQTAGDYQEAADYHGDLGEHGGDMAVYDPSSEVDTGGSYDSSYDASSSATDYSSTDYSSE